MYPHYPGALKNGEFAVVRFELDLLDHRPVTLDQLLGLRGSLRRTAIDLLGERALPLFDPPLSADPVAIRRYQKPAPGFVLKPEPGRLGILPPGESLRLDVLFLGSALPAVEDFFATLRLLGERGLAGGELPFEIAGISALGPDGCWQPLWHAGQRRHRVVPCLIGLDQWLERRWPAPPCRLTFFTPLRLVADGRVLRRPRFAQLFPFLLRRVTSLLHAYCALEPVDDPGALLRLADTVEASWSETSWIDWREAGTGMATGGLTGDLTVAGPAMEELLWIVVLASLFGVGKGAAYGAGQFRVTGGAGLAGTFRPDII